MAGLPEPELEVGAGHGRLWPGCLLLRPSGPAGARGPTRAAWRAWLAVSPLLAAVVARRLGATARLYAAPRSAGAATRAGGLPRPPPVSLGVGGFVRGCAYSRRGLFL